MKERKERSWLIWCESSGDWILIIIVQQLELNTDSKKRGFFVKHPRKNTSLGVTSICDRIVLSKQRMVSRSVMKEN